MLPRPWFIFLALASGAPAAAQEVKHPADVLPEDVLGYVELRQPGQIIKEVVSLTEGAMLRGAAEVLAKLREKHPTDAFRFGPDDLQIAAGMLGVFTAPELAAEIGRIEGVAVAVMGIDEKQEMPDFVGFVLPGDSNLPGIGFRMAVAGGMGSGYYSSDGKTINQARTSIEPVGKCEGVQLYQPVERRSTLIRNPDGGTKQAAPPVVREVGPALARLSSGVILVGTPERVKDVIRRATRKSTDASLAAGRAYRQAREQLGDKPGLFAFGNPAAGLKLAEQYLPGGMRELFVPIRDLVNPKAIAGVATSLTLSEGTLSYRWLARLDPDQKSLALEFLPSVPLKAELLHFAPRDALFVAALSNGEGGKRWTKLLELADAAAKVVAPKLPPPSRLMAGAEGTLGFKIGDDVLGKIDAVAVALPSAARLNDLVKSGAPPAVAIVQATDEAGATKLAREIIPLIVGAATLEFGIKPTEKKVGDEALLVLELGSGMPALVYGQRGTTLVIGANEALVAESLAAGVKKQGYLADEKAQEAVKRAGSPVLVAIGKPLTMAALGFAVVYEVHESRAVGPDGVPTVRRETIVPAETKALLKRLTELAKSEDPLVISFSRKVDQLSLEATYTGLCTLVPKAMDMGVEFYFQSEVSRPAVKSKASPPFKIEGKSDTVPKRLEKPKAAPTKEPPAQKDLSKEP